MEWISTNNLGQWANSRDCQDTIPKLIARLIRASVSQISFLNFPSGDHVQRGGWDGILESEEKTAYIPKGTSLWEFGAGKGIKQKLDTEFRKRTDNPEGFNSNRSTFIFVTPRPYRNKNNWITEKKKEGKWKDIRIYDDEILYQWIDACPSVGIWLASLIGPYPTNDCKSVDSHWNAWSAGAEFNISPQLLVTDRQIQVQALLNQFQLNKVIFVKGSSKSEALAFIIATFLIQNDGGYDFLSKTLIIDSPQQFFKLTSHTTPLYFIIDFDNLDSLFHAINKGHKVLVPVGAEYSGEDQDTITLPSMSRKGFQEALTKIGLSTEIAESYSRDSARNITILRRLRKFDHSQPAWAKDLNVNDLLPILLLGGWNEDFQGDIEIVSSMTGLSYPEYIKNIDRFIFIEDSPIVRIGSIWKLRSPLDSWTYIAKSITKTDIEILTSHWKIVLEEIDPKFSLESGTRLFANLYGNGRHYSIILRKGLCQTLILLNLFENVVGLKLGISTTQISSKLVKELLSTDNPKLWMSIHDQMQLIAEASPVAFIESLETQLNKPETPIAKLFNEEPGFVFPQSYLPGLLWATESLAWFPEYFPHSTLLLAKLAEMDPGGRLNNRPINSLKEIFKPWHPGTFANVHERLSVLTLISLRFPNTAWELLLTLLPSEHDVSLGTNKLKWLYLILSPTTYEVVFPRREFYDAIIDLLLDLTIKIPERIAELIRMSTTFPVEIRDKVIDLAIKNAEEISDPNRIIWNTLRSIIHNNSTNPQASWAISEPEIVKYVELRRLYDQQDFIDSCIWLFDENRPILPEGFPSEIDTFKKQETYINNLQTRFIENLIEKQGILGVIAYNELLTNRHAFASSLAKIELSAKELHFLILQFNSSTKTKDLVRKFLYPFTHIKGVSIIINQHDELLSEGMVDLDLLEVYISMKQCEELWLHINTLKPELISSFWINLEPYFGFYNDREIEFAIRRLLEFGRPFTVLSEVTNQLEKVPTQVLCNILSECNNGSSIETPFINEYSLRSIFEELQARTDITPDEVVILEWQFLPLLLRSGRDQIHLEMKTQLCRNPAFFNSIMEVLYDQNSISKLNSIQLENHYRFLFACDEVLNSINTAPGQNSDLSINDQLFREWLHLVRQDAIDKNRIQEVDFRIGRILGNFCLQNHSSANTIYEYIEEVKSKTLSDGFSTGILSTGKITWRAIDAGGKIEWNKRNDNLIKAKELRSIFPYVSSIYLDIADYYKEKAEREDRDALYQKLDDD